MLDYVEEVLATRTIEEVWNRHVHRMAEFGFPRLIYGFNRTSPLDHFGNPHDALILTEHDPTYLQRFIGEGLYRNAPMMRWAKDHTGSKSWAWVDQEAQAGRLSSKETEVIELNRTYGMNAGYTISFPQDRNRLKGVMSLGGAPDESQESLDAMWSTHGREIEAMNWVVHTKLSALPHAGMRRPLTKRQREVLELIAEGESVAGVAQSLGLSTATVEKHLRLARVALDVETTAAALHKATWQNQIFVH